MARKKKSKSKKKSEPEASGVDADDSGPSERGSETESSSPDQKPPSSKKKAGPKKKKAAPKKKRARKKASKKASGKDDDAAEPESKETTGESSDEEPSKEDVEKPRKKGSGKKSPRKKRAKKSPEKKRTRKSSKTEPDAHAADAAEVDASETPTPSDAEKPEAAEPEAAEPEKPEPEKPEAEKPEVEKPEAEKSETEKPEVAEPEPEVPEPEPEDVDAGDGVAADVERLVEDEPGPTDDDLVSSGDEAEIEDLDAIIEDDLDGSDDLDALIAATVAGAAPEDHVEDSPVQTLDEEEAAEESVEVVDIEAGGTEPPTSEAGDAAAETATDVEKVAPDETATEPTPSSEEELAGAIDLGDVSTPELRDRLLAQALAHAEMTDARYRVPFSDPRRAGRWKAGLATVLFLLAGLLAVAPPGWVRPDPPALMDAEARTRGIRGALLLQAQQVDAYRVRTQRLPGTLEDLPSRLDGIRYVRSGNGAFQLIAYTPDGRTVVYDSSNPAPEFERLARGWSVGGPE